MAKTIDPQQLAKLANITLTPAEADKLAAQFAATLDTISTLNELDTTQIEATPQVTSLANVFREDKVDLSRTFTQQQALSNAKRSHQGYFVIEAVIHET